MTQFSRVPVGDAPSLSRRVSLIHIYGAGANQLANWLLAQGLQRGETIAVFLPNKPAYPILWLACLAIDVYVPLPAAGIRDWAAGSHFLNFTCG